MTPADARALLAAPVRFERRSTYFGCTVCGALVVEGDQGRHRAAHRALVAVLDGGADGGGEPS